MTILHGRIFKFHLVFLAWCFVPLFAGLWNREAMADEDYQEVAGVKLKLSAGRDGQAIPLGVVVITPIPSEEGYIDLEFPRAAFSKAFLDEFFYKKNQFLLKRHPFSQRGVEAILTDRTLLVRLHFGVILHVRDDIPGDPTYQTFQEGKKVRARLRTYSSAPQIGKPKPIDTPELRAFFIAWQGDKCGPESIRKKLPDGSIELECKPGEHFPKLYEPRVLKGAG